MVNFHQDYFREARILSSHEAISSSVTMAIRSQPIPDFMKSVGGCNDPNTVKVAVIDGGIDASHPDFSFCNEGFCQGKRFSSPETDDWDNSRNNHGNHVTGVSFNVCCLRKLSTQLDSLTKMDVLSFRLLLPLHSMGVWQTEWYRMGRSVSVSLQEWPNKKEEKELSSNIFSPRFISDWTCL